MDIKNGDQCLPLAQIIKKAADAGTLG